MPETKRKKLEAKGWKLGRTRNLLGLSRQEERSLPAAIGIP
jgi:hypothetical protein